MKTSTRFWLSTASLPILLIAGAAPGQERSLPVRASLAEGQVRYVAPEKQASSATSAGYRSIQFAPSQSILARYAPYFGIADAASELKEFRSTPAAGAGRVTRYRQLYQGIPVIGGELVLSVDATGQMNSLSGEVSRDLQLRTVQPAIAAEQAKQIALWAIAKYYPSLRFGLSVSDPELSAYDPKLIGPKSGAISRLVWRLEVRSPPPSEVRELVLVDAANGAVALHFNQSEAALLQLTYSSNGGSALPGTLLCNEGQPLCTNGLNADADLAHRYGRDTYNFYFSHYGRDSYDNQGATLISSVNYVYSGCPNAFWNGTQMVYCAGAPSADDVVGHELTHAVTEKTSGLFYYYQSGAINESLSDMWGEFIDLTNDAGNDAPNVRWLMGEDFTGIGAIRNMANPPRFNQPDRMSSSLYSLNASDNGGVHRNSGINNKAASLMVDGGNFNGFTVAPIGIDKVAALYYRVQTQHLTSGADYADLYLALNQACRNMIGGVEGITGDDCRQVANATDAVEMNLSPTPDAGTEAQVCSVGQVATNTYYDSFEDPAATSRWTDTRLVGTLGSWFRAQLATDGKISFATAGSTGESDDALVMAVPVVVPAHAFLHFRHLFDQEAGQAYPDGGLVEFSTNGGASWSDAGALYDSGKAYNGSISVTGYGNPAEGRAAFVGASHGFVSTRYNLESLAGQSLLIRFRNTSDSSIYTAIAWVIDEVRIYTCGANTSGNIEPTATAGADQTVAPGAQVVLDGSASADQDGQIAAAQWTQVSGTQVAVTQVGRTVYFTAPPVPVQDQLVFRLTISDDRGAVANDDVTVTIVNQQPLSNAGTDQARKPRDLVLLQGSATDSDGSIASYKWAQIDGPTAGLDKNFNAALSNVSGQNFWLSTTPYAVGASFLYLNFAPNVLTNGGGVVPLQPGSEFSICQQITGNVCTARYRLTITGAVTAPVVANATQPQTWTLQGVSVSDGTPVTGTFMFDSNTAFVSNVHVSSASPAAQVLSFAAPSVPRTGTLMFRLTATDNLGGSDGDDVTITLTNQAPAANAGADQATKPRQTVQLVGSASDPDGSPVSIAWSQVSGPPVTLTNGQAATASFVAPSVAASGVLTFRMMATDSDGATAQDEAVVTVTNVAPTVSAGSTPTAQAGATVKLTGIAIDTDGLIGTYSWTQIEGSQVTLTGSSSATVQFTAPSSSVASVLRFRLMVTDNDSATASDEVSVNVNARAVGKSTSGGSSSGGGGGSLDIWMLAVLVWLMFRRQLAFAPGNTNRQTVRIWNSWRGIQLLMLFAITALAGCGGGGGSDGGGSSSSSSSGGNGGSSSGGITVVQAPDVLLTASAATVASGGAVELRWESANATTCEASSAWTGAKALSGSQVISNLTQSSTFQLSCTGTGGSANQSVSITVSTPDPGPSVVLTTDSSVVALAGSATLTWQANNAASCSASGGWEGSRAVSGVQVIGPLTKQADFTLQCTGPGGVASRTVSIGISDQLPPATPIATLAPGVVVLTPDVMNALDSVDEDALTFNGDVAITINEIFIASGTAYRAASVSHANGRTVVAVVSPTLDQVFSSLEIKGSYSLQSSQALMKSAASPGAGVRGAAALAQSVGGEFSYPWKFKFLDNASLSGDGKLKVDADVDLHYSSSNGLAGSTFRVDTLTTANANLIVGGGELFSTGWIGEQVAVARIPIPLTVVDSLLNLVGVNAAAIYIPIDVGVQASATGGVSFRSAFNATFSRGMRVDIGPDGSLSAVQTPGLGDTNFNFDPLVPTPTTGLSAFVTVTADALAGVRLRPQLLLLNSVASVGIDLKGGPAFSATFNVLPPSVSPPYCGTYKFNPQLQLQAFAKAVGTSEVRWPAAGPIKFDFGSAYDAEGFLGQPCLPQPAVTISWEGSPVAFNPLTVSVSVSPPTDVAIGTPPPSGQVKVSLASGECDATIDAAGSGSCSLTPKTGGAQSLAYQYKGDVRYSASKVLSRPVSVEKAATHTSLAANPNPAQYSTAVTFSAIVSPAIAAGEGQPLPTGSVTIRNADGSAACTVQLSSAPTTECSAVFTDTKAANYTAVYSGDANYAPSTSELLTVHTPAPRKYQYVYTGAAFDTHETNCPSGYFCTPGPVSLTATFKIPEGFTGTIDASGNVSAIELAVSVGGYGALPAIQSGDTNLQVNAAIFSFQGGKIVGWKVQLWWLAPSINNPFLQAANPATNFYFGNRAPWFAADLASVCPPAECAAHGSQIASTQTTGSWSDGTLQPGGN